MLQQKQRLGDFEVIRLLGKGGMGEVYEAQQFNPPRRVALKVLAPWLSQDDDALRRFWQEAAVPATLDHPSIVRIITSGKTPEGQAFYTMQLVHGLSLAEIIRHAEELPNTLQERTTPYQSQNGLMAPPTSPETIDRNEEQEELDDMVKSYARDRFALAAQVGLQAARALAYAHRKKVLHRDIKPSNLMLDHHGQLYIVDFGLTRNFGPAADGSIAGLRGTPWYMSPEQANGQRIDQRSDIYSLGVTLYELVTRGVGPYTASRQNTEAVLEQVRAGQMLPLLTLAPDVPKPLKRVIQKATAFHAPRRYQSAEEMVEALTECQTLDLQCTPPPKSFRKRSMVAACLLCGLAIVGLIAIPLIAKFADKRPDLPEKPGAGSHPHPSAVEVANSPPRERRAGAALNLLTTSNDLAYGRVLFGDGNYNRSPHWLSLMSPEGQSRTLYLLDNDPLRRYFEFQVDLRQPRNESRDRNRVGIFFGWHEPAGDEAPPRFFSVELVDRPMVDNGQDFPYGRINIGTCLVDAGKGRRAARHEWERIVLPLEDAFIPLPAGSALRWHRIRIQAHGDEINIGVDGSLTRRLRLSNLRMLDPSMRTLEPCGALGVWAENGMADIRNPVITMMK